MNGMLFLTPFVGLCKVAYNYMKFQIRFLPCTVYCVCPSATHASRHAHILTVYCLLYYCLLSTVNSMFPTVTKVFEELKSMRTFIHLTCDQGLTYVPSQC